MEKALALYVDMDLSVRQYNMMRNAVNAIHKNCFPSYYAIAEAKKKLIPENIEVTETSMNVPLQTLLDNTAKSILTKLQICPKNNITLECKWGFDGSSGHSLYKQKFRNEDATDEFMFVSSFVPLRILDDTNENVLWQNDRHSSSRLCRPIKILFTKENSQTINEVKENIEKEIADLDACVYIDNSYEIMISHRMKLTMIDGAVLNVLYGNKSCATCVLCGAKPSQMNDESIYQREVNEECYRNGISSLHAWIKFFECIVHIAYKLPVKTWRIDSRNTILVNENKIRIRRALKTNLGLLVDKIKPGYGTSNDGNTARRFFSNIEVAADITGVDRRLIYNFSLILRILSCGRFININLFHKLLQDTWQLYIDLYSWYYMPVTVHKILVHGIGYVRYSTSPLGLLSEEAIESCHKIIRSNRLKHTRKCGRVESNRDLIQYLILQSDPVISLNSHNILARNYNMEDIKSYICEENNLNIPEICSEDESDDCSEVCSE